MVVRAARTVNVNMNARIHPARRRAPAFGIYLPVRHCECSEAIHEGVVPPIAAFVVRARAIHGLPRRLRLLAMTRKGRNVRIGIIQTYPLRYRHPGPEPGSASGAHLSVLHCERSVAIHGQTALPIAAVVMETNVGPWIATSLTLLAMTRAGNTRDSIGQPSAAPLLPNQTHSVPSCLRVTSFHPTPAPIASVVVEAKGGSWIATSPAAPRSNEDG